MRHFFLRATPYSNAIIVFGETSFQKQLVGIDKTTQDDLRWIEHCRNPYWRGIRFIQYLCMVIDEQTCAGMNTPCIRICARGPRTEKHGTEIQERWKKRQGVSGGACHSGPLRESESIWGGEFVSVCEKANGI